MINRFFVLCLFSFLLVSCKSSFTTYKYEPISSLEQFNGTYINYGDSLSRSLGLGWKDINQITLEFETPEKLNISYPIDTGLVRISYKGKFKNNYFETYLEKKTLITIVLNVVIRDKLRIGKTNAGSMFIHRTSSNFGLLIPFASAADDGEYTYTYTDLSERPEEPYPFNENNKWGYRSGLNDVVVIAPQYDFAKLYQDSVACVMLNGKWALINRLGKLLTDYKYDKIETFYEGVAKAYIDDKEGYLNQQGAEVVPVIYNHVDYLYGDRIARSRLGDKYGYVTSGGVLYPPIFDDASDGFYTYYVAMKPFDEKYATVKIGEESYIIDIEGYAYKYKNNFMAGVKKPIEESKIKVSDLIEQKELNKNNNDRVQDRKAE